MFIIKIIKEIVKFIFKLQICLNGILIIFFNLIKIINVKKIFIHNFGSFGHTIMFPNLIRISEKNRKNCMYVLFYEEERHNNKIHLLFDFPVIYLPTLKIFQFFNYKRVYGETFGDKRIIRNVYIYLIKKLNKNLYFTKPYYKKIVKSNYPNIFSFNKKKENSYTVRTKLSYYNLALKSKPFYLPKEINEQYLKRLNNKKKICTVYYRYRQGNKKSLTLRNCSVSNYNFIVKYLLKKNYQILLFGDIERDSFKNFKYLNKVITFKSLNMDKKLFDLFAATNCELFIGCEGGAQFLSTYNKNKIMLDVYPYGYFPLPYGLKELSNSKINDKIKKKLIIKYISERVLYKKIYYKNKKLSPNFWMNELQFNLNPDKKYKIKFNDRLQIKKILEKHV